MKKSIAYIICVLFLVSFVSGDLCTESDNGKEYDEQGYVKYGVTRYEDLCVLSPDTDLRVEEGQYLKEYYCTDDDQRDHKIVDCTREGFDKCKAGECVGSQSSSSSHTTTPVYTGPECGNKKVETGETCDPPTKICYVGSDIGLCSATCQCEIKISSEDSSDELASGTDTADEDNTTTDSAETTSNDDSVDVVKTVESEPKKTKTSVEDTDGISTEKDRLALPKEPKKGLFRRMWGWFASLFN